MAKSRSSPQFRLPPHPWDSSPADAIDRRVGQLRGVFGIIGGLCAPDPEMRNVTPEDLSNFIWFVEDYIDDIAHCRKRMDAGKEVA